MIHCKAILRIIIVFKNISPVSVHYTQLLQLYSRQQIAGLLTQTED